MIRAGSCQTWVEYSLLKYVVKNFLHETKDEQDRVKHLSSVDDLEFQEIDQEGFQRFPERFGSS